MGSRRARGLVNGLIAGVLLIAVGLFVALGLLPGDLTGSIGHSWTGRLVGALGYASAFVPAGFLISGWALARRRPWLFLVRRLALLVLLALLADAALGLADPGAGGLVGAGGRFGASLGGALHSGLGPVGAWIFLAAAAAVYVLAVWGEILLESKALRALGPAGRKVGSGAAAVTGRVTAALASGVGSMAERLRPAAEEPEAETKSARAARVRAEKPKPEPREAGEAAPPREPVIHGMPEEAAAGSGRPAKRQGPRAPRPATGAEAEPEGAALKALEQADLFGTAEALVSAKPAAGPHDAAADAAFGEGAGGKTPLPPVSLLIGAEGPQPVVSHEELRQSAQVLTEKLADFGVLGQVGEIHPGPVITRFEFEPAPGIKVAQITSRVDDLALALRASRIRIVAPIPGKAAVGVEIPNHEMAVIYLKDIVTTDAFLNAPSELTLALGKDIGGAPYYAALEKMPHLLIAGTTGSGKSVCINSIIVSLLLRLGPDRLRMILIDPKMLELTVYNDVPHLVTSVVTEARDAARSLHWLTAEMERRYRHFAERGVRNLLSYNERYGSEEPLPYIVVVVDELADLMLTDAGEIEAPIARLAQMARAVGIHLILATQRPSVDVLTGVIKANFPARIAFQVASRVDSRTILDMNGAESLVGRGDMLYLPAGEPEPHRVHGAFVSDKETERVVSFLKRYRAGTPRIDIVSEALAGAGGATGEDPLFEEAARIVITHQQGSVSLLQRRLKVGYSRAARLMDMLEAQGIVGPPDGSKAREVLADLSTLDGMQGREDL